MCCVFNFLSRMKSQFHWEFLVRAVEGLRLMLQLETSELYKIYFGKMACLTNPTPFPNCIPLWSILFF